MKWSNLNLRSRMSLPLIFGIGLALSLTGGVASARPDIASQPLRDGLAPAAVEDEPILPLTYAHVITEDAPVYADPSHAASGEAPIRSLGAGYLWVSLAATRPVQRDGQAWYMINANEYVRAEHLRLYRPSPFQGVAPAGQPDKPFAWMVYSVGASAAPGEAPAQDAPVLSRYALVTIYEEQQVGDWVWYRVGENQWVDQRKVGVVRPSARPEGVGPNEKWIDVNLFEQTLAAYEGDRMMYATLVSTGLPQWATEEGLFRMWTKVKMARMSGRNGYPDYYYLEDVPWAMYFNKSFALHTAYWHDRFGFPHSHGCVNLAPKDAKWLFEWVTPVAGRTNWTMATADNPGAWVWVHK
jgi:lipoprotein-anchoring transpeptidase ErfK/SrfK